MAIPQNLERLVALVEVKLAGLGAFPSAEGMDARDEWRKREEQLADELASSERASIAPVRNGAGGFRLMMGGVSTTCTSGRAQLLRNWIAAARRRIEAGAA